MVFPHLFGRNSPLDTSKLDIGKYDKVLQKSKDNEDDAHENPDNKRTDAIRFRNGLRDTIVHVDQHKEKGEEETKSARNCLSVDREANPAGKDHQDAGGKVEPDVGY